MPSTARDEISVEKTILVSKRIKKRRVIRAKKSLDPIPNINFVDIYTELLPKPQAVGALLPQIKEKLLKKGRFNSKRISE